MKSLFAFALCWAALAAQAADSVQSRVLYFLSVQTLTVAPWVATNPRGSPIKVDMGMWSLSKPYDYRGSDTLEFLPEPKPVQPGEAAQPVKPLGSVSLAGLPRDVLVVVAEPKPGQLVALATERSPSGFGLGGVRVLNFLPTTTALRFGDQQLQLKSGETKVFPKITPDTELPLQIAYWLNEAWEPFYDGKAKVTSSQRIYLLLTYVEQAGRVAPRLRIVPENAQLPPKQKPTAKDQKPPTAR